MTFDRSSNSSGMSNSNRRRMSDADKAGFQARSPEGHAAKGMRIQGQEEVWIRIQADTFKNWANVTLREARNERFHDGRGDINDDDSIATDNDLIIDNLETDFADGTKLVALVEALQKRKLRHNKRPLNQHHELENIAIALDAIVEDDIKLVNIGNTDIHNGNLKLILGLIWSLIAHYQLGASNFPPKKLMMAWLKAVLPECNIRNFTSDWNSGLYLNALLDYCQPGLMPRWKTLDPNKGPANCQRAMEVAEKHFRIPMVLEPEYLASPHLDELSGMTYLSYFMKEESSPGYYATLNWVKRQIPEQRINNFRADWNDGVAACSLVKTKGGPVPNFRDLVSGNHPENWVSNLEVALGGGRKVGVQPVMEARDMANPNVEYLGVMAWVAQFQWITDKTPPGDRLQMQCNINKVRVGDECNIKVDVLEKDEVDMGEVTAEVISPSGAFFLDLMDTKEHDESVGSEAARATFRAEELGMHEVLVKNEGEVVRGTPHFLRVMPKSKKDYEGIEPCAVGSTVEVLINPHHAARPQLLEVTAYSPSGRPLGCPVSEDNGTFYASFKPDEAGEWKIHVTYDDQDIENSPFKCMVFNSRAVNIPDQESARLAMPGDPYTFTVDASKTGWGEVAIDVVFENRSIRRTFYVEEVSERIYKVTFTPQSRGKHRVYVYLHGIEVKGSPFSLRIGKDVRMPRKQATDIFKAERKVSRYKTLDEQKAEQRNYYTTEREVNIKGVDKFPVAPPRAKHKRQSLNDFRMNQQQQQQQQLFQSDYRTADGKDLLPVGKTVAFDCPLYLSGDDSDIRSSDDVIVTIKGPGGKKCGPIRTKLNRSNEEFTCEFTTSVVGEHTIDILVGDRRLDNVTSSFHTYDVSKIKVGKIPAGFVGTPVELDIDGTAAGMGNLEIIVNGGKVATHVSNREKGRFQGNFIPNQQGRHRVDIKFNGDKVGQPHFVDVKDPNTPLMSPGLLTNKMSREDTSPLVNGHATNSRNDDIIERGDEIAKKMLKSSDFNKLDSRITEEDNSFIRTTMTTQTKEMTTKTNTFETKKVDQKVYQDHKPNKVEREDKNVIKSSISEKKATIKTDPAKEFGTFSSLSSPGLLTGKTSSRSTSDNHLTTEESQNIKNVSSTSQMYSTTISKNLSNNSTKTESSFGGVHDSSFRASESNIVDNRKPFLHSSKEITSILFNSSQKPDVSDKQVDRGSSMPPTREARNTSLSPERNDVTSLSQQRFVGEKVSGSLYQKSSSSTHSKSFIPRRASNAENKPGAAHTSGGSKSYSSYSETTKLTSSSVTSKSNSSNGNSKVFGRKVSRSSPPSKGAASPSSGVETRTRKGVGDSSSPKLASYRGTAEKCKFEGETVRHFNAGKLAAFELSAPGHKKEDIVVNIISPEKRPHIPHKVVHEGSGKFRLEFTTVEVGSYIVDVTVNGLTVPNSPLVAKAYDSSMIRVTDIQEGHVDVMSTFRVDASKAGEGQLEISINDGDVPNAVQVLGGGKCLVTYTPEEAISHEIEVTFNNDQVPGSPFLCRVIDVSGIKTGGFSARGGPVSGVSSASHSKITLDLDHLSLIPVNVPSHFTIKVSGGGDAELAVSVQGPTEDIPVKVSGNIRSGFAAEFVPTEIGIHLILVEYNGTAVGGTPFYAKTYDSENVTVSESLPHSKHTGPMSLSQPGKSVTFAGSGRN